MFWIRKILLVNYWREKIAIVRFYAAKYIKTENLANTNSLIGNNVAGESIATIEIIFCI